MAEKTNAARILDRLKIKYELVEYQVDPENLAADHVAEELGEPIEQVYKTLVLRGDKNGVFVCVVAGNREVDLKKAAKAAGEKSVSMLKSKELLPLTGYIHGGCSPIGMKKFFPTFIDCQVEGLETFFFSGGKVGAQVEMAPEDLKKVIVYKIADVTAE